VVRLLADNQIADASNVSVADAGTLLDVGGHSESVRSLTMTGGQARMSGTQAGSAVLRLSSLALSGGGRLDLANNRMIIDYDGASPAGSLRSAIRSAYAAGGWTGPGLTNSQLATSPTRGLGYGEASDVLGPSGGTFAGQHADGTALLVRTTLSGDANLDGVVDFNDLVRLAQNYNVTDGARTWGSGDFNYDGNVDFGDLVKLAQSYNTVMPVDAPIAGAPGDFARDVAAAFAKVPEPGGMGVTIVILVTTLRRRGVRRGKFPKAAADCACGRANAQ
jgi:hypothetical protein